VGDITFHRVTLESELPKGSGSPEESPLRGPFGDLNFPAASSGADLGKNSKQLLKAMYHHWHEKAIEHGALHLEDAYSEEELGSILSKMGLESRTLERRVQEDFKIVDTGKYDKEHGLGSAAALLSSYIYFGGDWKYNNPSISFSGKMGTVETISSLSCGPLPPCLHLLTSFSFSKETWIPPLFTMSSPEHWPLPPPRRVFSFDEEEEDGEKEKKYAWTRKTLMHSPLSFMESFLWGKIPFSLAQRIFHCYQKSQLFALSYGYDFENNFLNLNAPHLELKRAASTGKVYKNIKVMWNAGANRFERAFMGNLMKLE
jgi:hypothetical protein